MKTWSASSCQAVTWLFLRVGQAIILHLKGESLSYLLIKKFWIFFIQTAISSIFLSCAGVDLSPSTFWSATQSLLVGYQLNIPPFKEDTWGFYMIPIAWVSVQLILHKKCHELLNLGPLVRLLDSSMFSEFRRVIQLPTLIARYVALNTCSHSRLTLNYQTITPSMKELIVAAVDWHNG